MNKNKNNLLLLVSLWLPIAFITPIIIFIQNPDDFNYSISYQIFISSIFLLFIVLLNWLLFTLLPKKTKIFSNSIVVALATTLVIQGYIINNLITLGPLDGSKILWSEFGLIYWVEVLAYVVFFIFLTFVLIKKHKHIQSISLGLILFSFAQLLLNIPLYFQQAQNNPPQNTIDESVYSFSSTKNVIHILADGFQADIVKQVFDENPELKKEFTGFDFFENHLGRYQSTSPTIPTLMTGQYFDLNKGYNHKKAAENIKLNSYANELYNAGYQLDYVAIQNIHCHKKANSCLNRSFNDLKARGYDDTSLFNSLLLQIDISLFRHTPLFFKKRIYNDGAWLVSRNLSNNWSPYPDPVIREWTKNLQVNTTKPVYKWYHFIGTHIPAQWDADCKFIGRQPQSREFYKNQTNCVLNGLAGLIRKLKKENIYDKTVFVINGDHGCNIAANDVYGIPLNKSTTTDAFLGLTRPLFMFKKADAQGDLSYINTPSTHINIAPSILNSVGLPIERFSAHSLYEKNGRKISQGQPRFFHRYDTKTYWSGEPISYNEYRVTGDIKNRANWELLALRNRPKAPSHYDYISYDTAMNFSKGLSLSIAKRKTQKIANITGTEFYILMSDVQQKAKKLAFTLSIPKDVQNQKVSIFINQKPIATNLELSNNNSNEITKEVILPQGVLTQENNLVKFEFSEVEDFKTKNFISAKLFSIYLK